MQENECTNGKARGVWFQDSSKHFKQLLAADFQINTAIRSIYNGKEGKPLQA
jgi:hypothetical protein